MGLSIEACVIAEVTLSLHSVPPDPLLRSYLGQSGVAP